MHGIYKFIIEKGGLLGIVFVFLLLLTQIVARSVKSRHQSSDEPLMATLKIAKYVCLISTIFFFGIEAFRAVDTSRTFNRIIEEQRTEIRKSDTSSFIIEKSIHISKKYELNVMQSGKVKCIKRSTSFWNDDVTYDTVFSISLNKIKEFRVYNFQERLVISYLDDELSSSEFIYTGQFSSPDFFEYVANLKDAGYNIRIKYRYMRPEAIIGIIMMVLGFLGFFILPLFKAIDEAEGPVGCILIAVLCAIIFGGLGMMGSGSFNTVYK